MKLNLIHRLPRALLVFAVSFFLFGATAAIAGDDEQVPKSVGVSAPQQGDAWVYHVRAATVGENVELWELELHNQRTPPTGWQGADGSWHASERIITQWIGLGAPLQHEHFLEAGVPVVHRTLGGGGSQSVSGTSGIGPIEPFPDTVTDLLHEVDQFEYWPGTPICGYASELQGNVLPIRSTIRVEGTCEGSYRFDGLETVEGMETLRFQKSSSNTGEISRETLWFAPHIPYPVQIYHEYQSVFRNAMVEQTFTMTGFESNSSLTASPNLPSAEHIPAARLVPRPVWGIDDSGVNHPFKLSHAWKAAMEDPDSSHLREFMEDHPDGGVFYANQIVDRSNDQVKYRWFILLSDGPGENMGGFHASRTFDESEEFPPSQGTLVSLNPSSEITIQWYSVAASGFAPISKLPDLMPSVASLIPIWNALGDEDNFNSYGVDYTCRNDCQELTLAVEVGQQMLDKGREQWADRFLGVDQEVSGNSSTLRVNGVGVPTQLRDVTISGRTFNEGIVAAPQGDDPADSPDRASIQMEMRLWGLGAPEVASVTFVAILAGLVYWLWPVLKSSLGVGLFSRLRNDELLKHPNRLALYQAIQAQPGIHHIALIKLLGKGKGVVDHHLSKLVTANLVVLRKSAGRTCYFIRGSTHHGIMEVVPHLSDAGARVLSFIVAQPGLRGTDVANQLGVAKSTVSHHIQRLSEVGLIRREGRDVYATDLGTQTIHAIA